MYALSYLPFDSKRLPPIDLDVRIVEALTWRAGCGLRELRCAAARRVEPIMGEGGRREGKGAKRRMSTAAAASGEGGQSDRGAADESAGGASLEVDRAADMAARCWR